MRERAQLTPTNHLCSEAKRSVEEFKQHQFCHDANNMTHNTATCALTLNSKEDDEDLVN
jgi:hypothetical protein